MARARSHGSSGGALDGVAKLVGAAAVAAGLGAAVKTAATNATAGTWAGRRDDERKDRSAAAEQEETRDKRSERPDKFLGKVYDWGDAHFKPLKYAVLVQKRFGELHGNNLAAAVTLGVFIALFPLLLVTIAIVGFVAHNTDTNIAGSIVRSLGLGGDAADTINEAIAQAAENRRATSIVGLLGLAWSALGLAAAVEYAFNQVWQVEPRGIKDRLMGLVWYVGFAAIAVASGFLTNALRILPGVVLGVLAIVAAIAVNSALFLWTMKILPNRDVGWKPLLPGAIFGGVVFEILKAVASFYVPRTVENSSALYGSIGVILAILAFLLLLGRVMVYSSVLNVVLYEQRYGTRTVVLEVPAGVAPTDDDATRSGTADPDETDDPTMGQAQEVAREAASPEEAESSQARRAA